MRKDYYLWLFLMHGNKVARFTVYVQIKSPVIHIVYEYSLHSNFVLNTLIV